MRVFLFSSLYIVVVVVVLCITFFTSLLFVSSLLHAPLSCTGILALRGFVINIYVVSQDLLLVIREMGAYEFRYGTNDE